MTRAGVGVLAALVIAALAPDVSAQPQVSEQLRRAAEACRAQKAAAPPHKKGCYDRCIASAECEMSKLVSGASGGACTVPSGTPCEDDPKPGAPGGQPGSPPPGSPGAGAPGGVAGWSPGAMPSATPPEVTAAFDSMRGMAEQWAANVEAENARNTASMEAHFQRTDAAQRQRVCLQSRSRQRADLRLRQRGVLACHVQNIFGARLPDMTVPPECTGTRGLQHAIGVALLALRHGDHRRALSSFEKAETLAPLWPAITVGKALALEALGRQKEGEEVLRAIAPFVATLPGWTPAARGAASARMRECLAKVQNTPPIPTSCN
jgi:hypothetical protein